MAIFTDTQLKIKSTDFRTMKIGAAVFLRSIPRGLRPPCSTWENVSLLTRVREMRFISCVRILPSHGATGCLKVANFRPGGSLPLRYGLALTAPVTWGFALSCSPLSVYIAA